jgi:isoprenylcysteine carboxyl methyltransferase (ICMT) family protein YpbQ
MFFVPVIYAASNWLDFANYTLPAWAGWLGVLVLAGALFVFWRAHADLGLNWSPSLEIREKHELITRGIYGVIRHPMYASQWLWVIAQPLLLRNWIAGFLNLLVFIPFYFLRVRAEEQLCGKAWDQHHDTDIMRRPSQSSEQNFSEMYTQSILASLNFVSGRIRFFPGSAINIIENHSKTTNQTGAADQTAADHPSSVGRQVYRWESDDPILY